MKKVFLFIMMVVVSGILFFPAASLAEIVYDNGESKYSQGADSGASNISAYIAADDFVLGSATTITGASVDVHDGPANENLLWDDTVEWWILSDSNGLPGTTVVASGSGQNMTLTNLEVSAASGKRNFTVDFEFGQGVPLLGGTTYWLALHFQADYNRDSVFWEYSVAANNNVAYSGGVLTGGVPDFTVPSSHPVPFGNDLTFRLTRKEKFQIPVRVCAVQGSPAAGAPNMDNILLQRLRGATDNVWANGAAITFQSAMPANTNAHFPVINDPNSSVGQPGDIQYDVSNSTGEFHQALASCEGAWKALGVTNGPIFLNVTRLVDGSGNPAVLGYGNFWPISREPSPSTPECKKDQFSYIQGYGHAAVWDNSLIQPNDPQEINLAHEFGHVLFLGHGNGQDDDVNGACDDLCDDQEVDDPAQPNTVMTPGWPGGSTQLVTPRQSRTARAMARATPGVTTSLSKPQPVNTTSDYGTDPAQDVQDDSVDIVSVGMVKNTATGTTIFFHSLSGIIPLSDDHQYVIFADLDRVPSTGGSPSTLGFLTTFTGAEIVTRVQVKPDASGEFQVVTPTIWRFEDGAFVEISDPQIRASITTWTDHESGVRLSDGVFIEVPSSDLGSDVTQARIQGIAQQLTTGELDRIPDVPTDGGFNISLIPPKFPECDVTPAQAYPGEQVTVEASGLLVGQLAKVFLGDQLVAETTIGSDGNAITSFIIPYPVRTGLRLISVAVAGTALSTGNLFEILEDTISPQVTITTPTANDAIQDGVTLTAEASDIGGIASVSFYVREMGGTNGIPIGFENLPGTFNGVTGKWEYNFDTTKLPDGYYVILAKAVDTSGNEGWSAPVPFSIRNWAVIKLLPSTPSSKAGRTMPVKFSLRIAATVDPAMPFVYNEDLEIRIYRCNNGSCSSKTLMQTSTYGTSATDYRINGELYITNFKTTKTPAQYLVEIWRPTKNFMVGDFTFKTVK